MEEGLEMRKFSVIFTSAVVSLLTLVLTEVVNAQSSVVVPNAFTNKEGDGNNIFPFDCAVFFGSMRYQQVYLGSQLGSGVIDAISFRLNQVEDGFAATLPGVGINMSTTQASPGNLSSTFADNVGPDETVVFSGDLELSAPGCTSSPCPFVIDVPLENAFPFDGSTGNLLIDISIPVCVSLGGGSTAFDAVEIGNFTSRAYFGAVDSPTGTADNVALVTKFTGTGLGTVSNIPTLSEWGMISAAVGLGLIGVFFAIKRKKAKTV
jgi:hypothetical protein